MCIFAIDCLEAAISAGFMCLLFPAVIYAYWIFPHCRDKFVTSLSFHFFFFFFFFLTTSSFTLIRARRQSKEGVECLQSPQRGHQVITLSLAQYLLHSHQDCLSPRRRQPRRLKLVLQVDVCQWLKSRYLQHHLSPLLKLWL